MAHVLPSGLWGVTSGHIHVASEQRQWGSPGFAMLQEGGKGAPQLLLLLKVWRHMPVDIAYKHRRSFVKMPGCKMDPVAFELRLEGDGPQCPGSDEEAHQVFRATGDFWNDQLHRGLVGSPPPVVQVSDVELLHRQEVEGELGEEFPHPRQGRNVGTGNSNSLLVLAGLPPGWRAVWRCKGGTDRAISPHTRWVIHFKGSG